MIIKGREERKLKPARNWHIWFAWHPVYIMIKNPKRNEIPKTEENAGYYDDVYPYYVDRWVWLSKCLRHFNGLRYSYKLLNEAMDDE